MPGTILVLLATAGQPPLQAQRPNSPSEVRISIRGHEQRLPHFLPSVKDSTVFGQPILLASGDGGLGDFEETIAQRLSGRGYDVYEFDVRRYLADFTGTPPLTPAEVMADFASLAKQIRRAPGDKPLLIGWSAGAALVVTAAASKAVKEVIRGVIAISLPREGVLAWRWWDRFQFLPGVHPSGPLFSIIPFIPRIAPLTLVIIQSTGDRWVSEEDIDDIFEAAKDQQTFLLEAGGHRFSSNRKEFYRKLDEALELVKNPPGAAPADAKK